MTVEKHCGECGEPVLCDDDPGYEIICDDCVLAEKPTDTDMTELLDRRPTHHHNAAHPSGEVFAEYAVVDLSTSFPAERHEWAAETVRGPDQREEHLVVPFRVVERGFGGRRAAKERAKQLADGNHHHYKAVQISDLRGL